MCEVYRREECFIGREEIESGNFFFFSAKSKREKCKHKQKFGEVEERDGNYWWIRGGF